MSSLTRLNVVLGPSLAGKRPNTDQNLNLYFSFLLRPLVSLCSDLFLDRFPGPRSVDRGVFGGLRTAGSDLAVGQQPDDSIELFGPVFCRFSAKLGPQTPLDRRGSSCSAGCTKNQPRRPMLRPTLDSQSPPRQSAAMCKRSIYLCSPSLSDTF